MWPSLNVLNGRDALGARGMGKHILSIRITNAVHVRHRLPVFSKHFHLVRDRNKASSVGLRSNLIETQPLSERNTARRNEARVHLHDVYLLLCLKICELDLDRLDSWNTGLHVGRQDTCFEVDVSWRDQRSLGNPRDLAVESWHDLIHGFDESDFTSQGSVYVRELQTNVPASDDRYPLWNPLQLQSVVAREDGLPVDFDARRHERDGARRDDDVPRGKLATHVDAAWKSIRNRVVVDKLSHASVNINTQGDKRVLQVSLDRSRELVGVIRNTLAIKRNASYLNAHRLEVHVVLHLTDTSARREQGFARDAASVHARASDVMAFDDARLETLLDSVERCSVPTNTTTDDTHVIVVGRGPSLVSTLSLADGSLLLRGG
mmetsp:Transcript_2657/g.4382  ORF Transcript_2657/g.4382 Transcript_2657/m.4382 type:complete len:377 (+) Transcript_2657:470-1600(+)